jgi:hypothetical protein
VLSPLFPVEELRAAVAFRAPASGAPRQGHMWPIAVLFGDFDQPAIVIELGFRPPHGLPELLADESWETYRDTVGLTPFVGASSLQGGSDGQWFVDFGPHTLVSNPSRSFLLVVPRPDPEWEEAVRANGSCVVLIGTGLAADEETGDVDIPPTAAATIAAYAGSRAVPELSEIPGLYVVPVNSFQPYDPLLPVTFVLDADVLIEMQHYCFSPARLRSEERVEAIRDLLINISGRDVLPGPALSQLSQPSRTTTDARAALEPLATFEHLMSLSRAELMDCDRPLTTFDPSYQREILGATVSPHMLVMYAGVLRLRQLWNPSQKLAERARSFESFIEWLRFDLRMNAGLLVQVAFNLWMSNDEAQRQASRLLHFHTSDRTLSRLWGTAYDLTLVVGHADAMLVEGVVNPVILTFDQGLAGMRNFFEHVEVGEVASTAGLDPSYGWNARMNMNFHPRLEHMQSRVAEWLADLHGDMLKRMGKKDWMPFQSADLLMLVEREERLVLGWKSSDKTPSQAGNTAAPDSDVLVQRA